MFTDDEFKSLKKGNKVKGYTKFDFTDGALNYSEQTAITIIISLKELEILNTKKILNLEQNIILIFL